MPSTNLPIQNELASIFLRHHQASNDVLAEKINAKTGCNFTADDIQTHRQKPSQLVELALQQMEERRLPSLSRIQQDIVSAGRANATHGKREPSAMLAVRSSDAPSAGLEKLPKELSEIEPGISYSGTYKQAFRLLESADRGDRFHLHTPNGDAQIDLVRGSNQVLFRNPSATGTEDFGIATPKYGQKKWLVTRAHSDTKIETATLNAVEAFIKSGDATKVFSHTSKDAQALAAGLQEVQSTGELSETKKAELQKLFGNFMSSWVNNNVHAFRVIGRVAAVLDTKWIPGVDVSLPNFSAAVRVSLQAEQKPDNDDKLRWVAYMGVDGMIATPVGFTGAAFGIDLEPNDESLLSRIFFRGTAMGGTLGVIDALQHPDLGWAVGGAVTLPGGSFRLHGGTISGDEDTSAKFTINTSAGLPLPITFLQWLQFGGGFAGTTHNPWIVKNFGPPVEKAAKQVVNLQETLARGFKGEGLAAPSEPQPREQFFNPEQDHRNVSVQKTPDLPRFAGIPLHVPREKR